MYDNNNIHKCQSLERGQEFQDFIVEKTASELCVTISLFQSKKYQFDKGESLQGVEIKYDARSTGDCTYYKCSATGNVGIEVAEKSSAQNEKWVKSGIYRRDNTWLYIVGNYDCAWVFTKNILVLLHQSKRYNTVVTLPTIKSMLLPIPVADKYCAKKMVFKRN